MRVMTCNDYLDRERQDALRKQDRRAFFVYVAMCKPKPDVPYLDMSHESRLPLTLQRAG